MKDVGTQQIEVMKSLGQQAAAWLLGCTSRTLRDRADAPRKPDGTYDAQGLVAWNRSRITPPELTDDEHERLLLIKEFAIDRPLGGQIIAVFETMTELARRYGDAGILAMGRLFLDEWREQEASYRSDYREPTPEEQERQEAERRRVAACDAAIAELRLVIQCETCKRIRHGRTWEKASPPAGFMVVSGPCPRCSDDS